MSTPQRSIVEGRYKLSVAQGTDPELLDLDTDPDEWHNRADDPAYRDVRARFEQALYADLGCHVCCASWASSSSGVRVGTGESAKSVAFRDAT